MKIDLHTHTCLSDGKLGVQALITLAQNRRIEQLSITDHDTVAAYRELPDIDTGNLTVIPGIEFSTCWERTGVHIVGLNIDLQNRQLAQGIEFQSRARRVRAEKIAGRLCQVLDIEDPLPAVRAIAGNDNIGRPHFAQHLLNTGVVDNMETVFRKYLGPGKAGDVRETWADLAQVVEWITAANGIAVLAHPLKYRLTRTRLLKLLDEFREAGGTGMEVVSGQQHHSETLCNSRELLASCGSDFHDPENAWSLPGRFADLPDMCTPVWTAWMG